MKRFRFLATLLVVALALAMIPACPKDSDDEGGPEGDSEDQEFDEALIDADDLTIEFDEGALTGVLEQALTGEPQELRETVRARVIRTNQFVKDLFTKIREIVAHEAAVRRPLLRGWGPFTKDGVEYRFWLRKLLVGRHFQYLLTARPGGDNAAFQGVLWGAFHRIAPFRGAGRMFLHFDRMQEIKADYPIQGTAWLHFQNLLPVKRITLLMKNVAYGDEEPVSAAYQFGRAANGLRGFRFLARADMRGGDAREFLAVRAGWNSEGAGRADAVMWGGDIAAAGGPVVGHECWSAPGQRVYLAVDPDPDSLSFGSPEECVELFREAYDTPDPEGVEEPVSDTDFDIEDMPAEDMVDESPPSEG